MSGVVGSGPTSYGVPQYYYTTSLQLSRKLLIPT